ncbi:mucosal addressin cell adhesion molecule 1 isoform X2 [Lissotriton helveticus]
MGPEVGLLLLLALLPGCAAGQPFRRENQVSLLPKDALVHLGVSVQFNCSTPCPNAIFTWKGLDTKPGHVTSTPQYSLLYIASTAPHNEGSIICKAICGGHEQQRTSLLRLYSLPDTMQLTLHPERGSGQPDHLICSIRRVHPLDALTLSWYRGEERLETPEQQNISSEEEEMDDVQSFQLRLDLPGREAMEGEEYRCEAELKLRGGTMRRNKTIHFSAFNGHAVDPTTGPREDCCAGATVTVNSNPTNEPETSTGHPATETSPARNTGQETVAIQGIVTGATVQAKPDPEAATTRLNPKNKIIFYTVNPKETSATSVNPTNESVMEVNHLAERARKGLLRNETFTSRWNPTQVASTSALNPRTGTVLYRRNPVNVTPTATLRPRTGTVLYRRNPVNVTPTATLNPRTETVLYRRNPVNVTPTATLSPRTETVLYRRYPANVTPTATLNPRTETVLYRRNPVNVTPTATLSPRTETALYRRNPVNVPPAATLNPRTETVLYRRYPVNVTPTATLSPRTETVLYRRNPVNVTPTATLSPRTETVLYRRYPANVTPTATLNPRTETVLYRRNPVNVTPTATLSPRTETVLYRRNPVNVTPTPTLNPRTETLAYGTSPTNTMVMFTKNPTNRTLTFRVTPTNETVALGDNTTAVNSTTRGKPRNETVNTRIQFTTATAVARGVDATGDPKRKITVASRRPILSTQNTDVTDSITKRRGYSGTKHTSTPEDNTAPPISSKSHPTERVPPKPGVDPDSVAVWSVFSFLGLLTSGLGVHLLSKRLTFPGTKKGSFDLARL